MRTPEELEELWRDPKHYKWGSVYFCEEDPRIIVPKRQKWAGWTVNFAHPQAWWVLLTILFMPILPALIAFYVWPKTELGLVIALVLGGLGVVFYCVILHRHSLRKIK